MSEDRQASDYDLRVERLVHRAGRLQARLRWLRSSSDAWQGGAPIKAVFWALTILGDLAIIRVADSLSGGFIRKRIHRPPVSAMNSVARFIYSKRTYERIFMQLVLDLREEHAEALQAKCPKHAWWIAMRGNIIMLITMATHAFTSCGKTVVKLWKLTP